MGSRARGVAGRASTRRHQEQAARPPDHPLGLEPGRPQEDGPPAVPHVCAILCGRRRPLVPDVPALRRFGARRPLQHRLVRARSRSSVAARPPRTGVCGASDTATAALARHRVAALPRCLVAAPPHRRTAAPPHRRTAAPPLCRTCALPRLLAPRPLVSNATRERHSDADPFHLASAAPGTRC